MATVKWSEFLGTDYITGLKLTWAGDDALTIGTGAAYLPAASPILVSAAISLTGMTLANSTWYYLYLYNNSGTPAVEYTTTAPAAPYFGTARTKTGDTSRRYIGAFVTEADGDICGFINSGDTILYTAARLVINNGTATTDTSIPQTGYVPSTSSMSIMYWRNLATNATVTIKYSGAVLSFSMYYIDSDQSICPSANLTYIFDAAPNAGFYAYVAGYIMER